MTVRCARNDEKHDNEMTAGKLLRCAHKDELRTAHIAAENHGPDWNVLFLPLRSKANCQN